VPELRRLLMGGHDHRVRFFRQPLEHRVSAAQWNSRRAGETPGVVTQAGARAVDAASGPNKRRDHGGHDRPPIAEYR
jgi:hypothetical protein